MIIDWWYPYRWWSSRRRWASRLWSCRTSWTCCGRSATRSRLSGCGRCRLPFYWQFCEISNLLHFQMFNLVWNGHFESEIPTCKCQFYLKSQHFLKIFQNFSQFPRFFNKKKKKVKSQLWKCPISIYKCHKIPELSYQSSKSVTGWPYFRDPGQDNVTFDFSRVPSGR